MPVLLQSKDWDDLTQHMRQMMERMQQVSQDSSGHGWHPPVDIYEIPEAVVLVMEAAGMKSGDLRVTVDGQVVNIYGQRDPVCRHKQARFHRLEIQTGFFTRSFRLNRPIRGGDARADLLNGLLYITIPKEVPVFA